MQRTIIVTGAAGALGQVVVKTLAQSGARVVAVDIAPSLGEIGQAEFVGSVDLTDPAAVAGAYARIAASHGALHGLANIAGGFRWEEIGSGDAATWDLLFNLNVRSTFNSCHAALPALIDAKGSIVNIGAAAALKAPAGMAPYAASKAGVARLTEALAEEVKDTGVRVNAVLPSIIDTPANRADMPDADYSRWVAPADLANVIAFLLSDAARAVTGACLPVTGRV